MKQIIAAWLDRYFANAEALVLLLLITLVAVGLYLLGLRAARRGSATRTTGSPEMALRQRRIRAFFGCLYWISRVSLPAYLAAVDSSLPRFAKSGPFRTRNGRTVGKKLRLVDITKAGSDMD